MKNPALTPGARIAAPLFTLLLLASSPLLAAPAPAKKNPRQTADTGLLDLKGHADGITCLAFSPDNKLLASGSADHAIILWDVATGKLIRRLEGHLSAVTALAFSPDGKWLVSVGSERGIVQWSTAAWRIEKIAYSSNMCYSVRFFPDSKRFAVSGDGVQLWTLGAEDPVLSVDTDDDNPRFILTRDGDVVTGNDGGVVAVWDPLTGKQKREHKRPRADLPRGAGDAKNWIMGLAELPNGHILVGDYSGLWEWDRTESSFTWIARDLYTPDAATPDGRYIFGQSDNTVWIRDGQGSPVTLEFRLVFQPHAVVLSPDAAHLAYAGGGTWSDGQWRSGGPGIARILSVEAIAAGVDAQRATLAKGKSAKPTPDATAIPPGLEPKNGWDGASTTAAHTDILP